MSRKICKTGKLLTAKESYAILSKEVRKMAKVLSENAIVQVDGRWLTLRALLVNVSGGKRVIYINDNGETLKSESLSKSQFIHSNINGKKDKKTDLLPTDSNVRQKNLPYTRKDINAAVLDSAAGHATGSAMRSITTDDEAFTSNTGGSSRGYTAKAKIGNIWYKVSAGTFNAQAEVVASRLARHTNIVECVDYEMCKVNGKYATASSDFLAGLENETVKSLHAKVTGAPIEPMLEQLSGNDLFKYVTSIVRTAIGLDLSEPEYFRKLSLLLQFDALVLNEDRHFNNVKFVKRTGGWELAPAFDFDCSLFSCVEDLSCLDQYPQPSQPFFTRHSEQLEWLYSMSDDRLTIDGSVVSGLTEGVWEENHQVGKREVEAYLASVIERVAGAE